MNEEIPGAWGKAMGARPSGVARAGGWLRFFFSTRVLSWFRFWLAGWQKKPGRQLHLCETLALGERRFLAVVEVERQRFLIGATGSSLALLTLLPPPETARLRAERLPGTGATGINRQEQENERQENERRDHENEEPENEKSKKEEGGR